MKKHFVLENIEELGFTVFGINSHAKGYKLCWNINKTLELNFEKVEDQSIDEETTFSRYNYTTKEGVEYNIVTNRSKKGYLIPNKKNINYFLIVNNENKQSKNEDIVNKLRKIKDVLLVFELDIKENEYIDRFIFNDKKD